AGGNNIEVALDIEMVICMAPKVSKIIVYEENPSSLFFNPEDVVTRMADDNLAKQMSSSWTWTGGPDPIVDNAFILMQAHGQSFFQAAGDSDAYTGTQLLDNDNQTNTPVGSTNITVVGGTTLTMNGTGASWSSETVWNWASLGGKDANVGSGGGVSTYYGIPWWQTNVNMSFNNGSTTMRNIPDVALTADNIFVVYTSGRSTQGSVGGTSCAAPLWAAFTALVNQQATASGKGTVGFANPAIYRIGAGPSYNSCFHDTTTGNNIGTGTAGLYNATNGYDLCTGWGTPNGTNLINALGASPPYFIQAPVGLTVSNGQDAALNVIPGGEPPFGYRWQLNGTNLAANGTISGTGSNVLTFTSIATNYTGNYSVIVTNAFGSITSSVVTITVTVPAPITPPTANFTAGPTIGVTPLVVNFTNSTTGATNYSWSFGDGNVSTAINPVNTYTTAGNYTVTLTAIGAGGTNSVTQVNYIVATNPPLPTVSFTGTPTSGLVPLTVNFANASSGAMNYSWNFGDGNSNTAVNPAHTYTTAGSYTVALTAVGAGGTNSFARASYIIVTNNPPPVVAFVASTTNGGAPLTVLFTNLTAGATNYSWDFGDGQTNAAVNPTNIYQSEGSYTVTLTAFGPGGQGTLVQSNYIVLSNSVPVLAPITNETVHPGMTVLFTNSATDPDVNQTLMFSLDPDAPASASVDSGTGVFTWTPDSSYANTTNAITVRVTDNGVPLLSAAQSFNVTVVPLVFQPVSLSNGVLTISWGSISGVTYRVQYTTNLAGSNWIDLPPDVMATDITASTTDFTSTDAQRFYRVVVVP
ncbi:MAG TPA: PKD domain-containing protein, partial [Verrucomicrobiae bacterium]|nr:PKD domain-containing protein [Verrucomicrobiae bacterium]